MIQCVVSTSGPYNGSLVSYSSKLKLQIDIRIGRAVAQW